MIVHPHQHRHIPDIDRMKSVYIFAWVKHVDDCVLVDVGRQGQLYEHAVNVRVMAECTHSTDELLLTHCARKAMQYGMDAHLQEWERDVLWNKHVDCNFTSRVNKIVNIITIVIVVITVGVDDQGPIWLYLGACF